MGGFRTPAFAGARPILLLVGRLLTGTDERKPIPKILKGFGGHLLRDWETSERYELESLGIEKKGVYTAF